MSSSGHRETARDRKARGDPRHLKRTNAGQPFNSLWLSQFRLGQYFDLVVQGTTVAICALLAVLIACLGLFVLAATAGIAIAWLTVSWQSFTVAKAKPAGALRYE